MSFLRKVNHCLFGLPVWLLASGSFAPGLFAQASYKAPNAGDVPTPYKTITGWALCANMTETSCVTAISEQGGKENQYGNDERFCSARCRCDGSI